MSPKAKFERHGESGEDSTGDTEPAAPASADLSGAAPVPVGAADIADIPDPSPFDSEAFLEANRRNREKMRAAEEARRAKAVGRGRFRTGDDDTSGRAESDRAESVPAASDPVVAPEQSRQGRRLVVPILATLLIAALVSTGVFAYLYRDADRQVATSGQVDELRPGAVESAGRYATELLTYDSADFAELDGRITDISTPEFAKDFIEGSRQAREGSANAQAVASAKVKEAAVQSISSTEAVVLVAMDQTVKSPQTDAQIPEGISYQSMVKVTMQRVDGGWLLSDLTVV